MAKAATDEQVQLRRRARRRLIGAMALVTVIAVVLPWVLESEPRPSEQEISIQIPSQDSGAFDARVGSREDATQKSVSPATGARSGARTDPGGAEDGTLRAEQEKVLAAPPRSAAQDPPAHAASAPKKSANPAETAHEKQFVVQITALADADKAGGIQHQLTAKGLKAYTEKVKTAGGEVTRVRVGPFPSREAAEKERARLKALGFEGNVTPR